MTASTAYTHDLDNALKSMGSDSIEIYTKAMEPDPIEF
jgi:hypothetical protein